MNATRRTFLKGLAVTGGSTLMPTLAFSNQQPWYDVKTSFLPLQPRLQSVGMLHALVVNHDKQQNPQLKISMERFLIDEETPSMTLVESLGHAEHILLHSPDIPVHNEFDYNIDYSQLMFNEHHRKGTIHAFHLVNCSNRIALFTRRGPGNIIIYHPDNRQLIPGAIKRTPSYITHETKNCPKDRVICFYNGSGHIDSGFIYSPEVTHFDTDSGYDTIEYNKNGKNYLWSQPTNSPFNAINYMRMIKLKNVG